MKILHSVSCCMFVVLATCAQLAILCAQPACPDPVNKILCGNTNTTKNNDDRRLCFKKDGNNELLCVKRCFIQILDFNLVPIRLKNLSLEDNPSTVLDVIDNEDNVDNVCIHIQDCVWLQLMLFLCFLQSYLPNATCAIELSTLRTTPISIDSNNGNYTEGLLCDNQSTVNTTKTVQLSVWCDALMNFTSFFQESQNLTTNGIYAIDEILFRKNQRYCNCTQLREDILVLIDKYNSLGYQEYLTACNLKQSRIWLEQANVSTVISINISLLDKQTSFFKNLHLVLTDDNCTVTIRILIAMEVSEYVRTSHALEIINVVGHSLSLISLLCIAATAIVFKQWRQDVGNKILLNMAAAILFNIPLFFIISYTSLDEHVAICIAFGVLLHYSCLACFCWMLVMSGLQLLRLVTVVGAKGISHLLLKVGLFAWGAPLIPIIVLLVWDTGIYSTDMEAWGFCFPRGKALLITVRAPLYIILTINLVVFIVILCRLYTCCGWGKIEEMRRHGDTYKQSVNRTRTTVALFFMLGLPWTIGYLLSDPIMSAYLFSITLSNQGVILFLFFVVLDEKTRKDWKELFVKVASRYRRKSTSSTCKLKEIDSL